MQQGRRQRLSVLINRFAFRYQQVHGCYSQTGALAQLWLPQELPAGLCLTTNEAPFAFAGCSDKLAVYRFYTGKYQPTCGSIDAATQCPIVRMYANLQPEEADVGSANASMLRSKSSSTSSSGSAVSQFDRAAAAELAGIHSTLLLPIYDATGDGEACQPRPLAVFELAHLEKGVDFSSASHILSEESQACGFWVPEYSSAQPIKANEVVVQQQGALPESTPSHPGEASVATAQPPARLWSTNWLLAEEPLDQDDRASHPQQQQRRGRRMRRSSVIYTEHFAYDQDEQRSAEPDTSLPAASQLLRGQPVPLTGQMQTLWESGADIAHHQHNTGACRNLPPSQLKQDYMCSSSTDTLQQQQQQLETDQQLLWQLRAMSLDTFQQDRRPSTESKRISIDSKHTSIDSIGRAASDCVRAVVTMGGKFKYTGAAGGVEYCGGLQKVISVSRRLTLRQLMNLLSSRAAAEGDHAGYLEVKYALPGVAGSLIDLKTEDDLINMFEELDDYAAFASGGMARLQLYVDTTAYSRGYEGTSSSGGSDVGTRLISARMGACQLQPSTPTTSSNASNAADAAARLCLHPSMATVSTDLGYSSTDNGTVCEEGSEVQVIVPFCTDRSKSAPMPFPGFGYGHGEAGFGWGVHDTTVAVTGDPDDSSEQFATAIDMTAALDDFHGDPEVAAALAALAKNTAPGHGATKAATCSDSYSHESSFLQAKPKSAALDPACKQDAMVQKDLELKQLIKQLKGQVEVIMPYELRILRCIGGGAFGEVYLAKWHGTDVAVKCLHPSLVCSNSSYAGSSTSGGSEAAAELMREAATLAQMHHPNIVSVYGVVLPPRSMVSCSFMTGQDMEEGGDQSSAVGGGGTRLGGQVSGPAMVCEYMSAGSVQNAIRSKAAWLNSNMAKAKVMLDTARGLAYLHSKSMVHFDLKSGNLLYCIKDRTPTVKVADFGLSKQRHQTYVTGVDSMRGTLPWIAPEIIKNPANVSEAADIYSYGVILWELWTGQEPFEGIHLHALLHQLASQGGLSLPVPGSLEWNTAEAAPEEPVPGWCALMKRCWAVNPDERPTSRQLVMELEAMMAELRKGKQ